MLVGHDLLQERLIQCGLFSYDKFNAYIQDVRRENLLIEVKLKVFPASDTAHDELTKISEYVDKNNYVIVMNSKCDVNCGIGVKKCSQCTALPCGTAYLVTPKFHRLFGDLFHFADRNGTYIVALKRKHVSRK
jgi:hypothetical protein